MILCDWEIERAIITGDINLHPWDAQMLQPASVDVRLDNRFRLFHPREYIDPSKPDAGLTYEEVVDSAHGFLLAPGQFVLSSTAEVVGLASTYAARIEGKSSLARLGVIVHSTAGFVDPGFRGQLTLEMTNLNSMPVLLYPGMKIAQLSFMKIAAPDLSYGDKELGSHYQGQRGPTASRMYEGWQTS